MRPTRPAAHSHQRRRLQPRRHRELRRQRRLRDRHPRRLRRPALRNRDLDPDPRGRHARRRRLLGLRRPATIVGTPAQNGLATGCYRYTLTGTDNVGNSVSRSTVVKVDLTDPTAPSLSLSESSAGVHTVGTTAFYRPQAPARSTSPPARPTARAASRATPSRHSPASSRAARARPRPHAQHADRAGRRQDGDRAERCRPHE